MEVVAILSDVCTAVRRGKVAKGHYQSEEFQQDQLSTSSSVRIEAIEYSHHSTTKQHPLLSSSRFSRPTHPLGSL